MPTDINKVPDADVISKRIFSVMSLGEIEKEMVTNILDGWNEEWIDYVAENQTGKSDGTKRSNDKRLKDRIDRLGGTPADRISGIDQSGF